MAVSGTMVYATAWLGLYRQGSQTTTHQSHRHRARVKSSLIHFVLQGQRRDGRVSNYDIRCGVAGAPQEGGVNYCLRTPPAWDQTKGVYLLRLII